MTRLQFLQYAYIGISKTIEEEEKRVKKNYHPETAQARLQIAKKHLDELTSFMQRAYEKSQPE